MLYLLLHMYMQAAIENGKTGANAMHLMLLISIYCLAPLATNTLSQTTLLIVMLAQQNCWSSPVRVYPSYSAKPLHCSYSKLRNWTVAFR